MQSKTALKDEVKQIFSELFGPGVADNIDCFDRPDMYPKDFLDECTFFLGKLIGDEAAKNKLEPLYRKYITEKDTAKQKLKGGATARN